MSRVLFITSSPCHPWAGEGCRTRHILEALVALGHQVDLVTIPSAAPFRVQGVATHFVPRLPFCKKLPRGASLRRGALDLLMLFKAVFLAGRARYDIIHGVADCGAVAWLVGALTNRPFVYDVRDEDHGAPVAWFRRWTHAVASFLSRRALRRADVIIGENADALAAPAQQGCGARACVIPNLPALTGNVPAPVLNLARTRYRAVLKRDAPPPPPDDSSGDGAPAVVQTHGRRPEDAAAMKVVTCVGGYDHFRGLAMFFNAVPYVLRENPDVRFVAAGGTGKQIACVRDALEQAGVAGAVTFTGCLPQPELAALLMVSDILVAPCCAGSEMPMRVLDFLYLSKPIVVADTGFSKIMFSSHNAMVVGAEHEALAKGILHLCRNPRLAEELARKGHETLLVQHRTPEAFREALRMCYQYGMTGERG